MGFIIAKQFFTETYKRTTNLNIQLGYIAYNISHL